MSFHVGVRSIATQASKQTPMLHPGGGYQTQTQYWKAIHANKIHYFFK